MSRSRLPALGPHAAAASDGRGRAPGGCSLHPAVRGAVAVHRQGSWLSRSIA